MDINIELEKDYSIFLSETNIIKTSEKIKYIVNEINNFFLTENLDSCVLGISGGIDSAVVLALLIESKKQNNSPIKKIVPLSLPFISALGATEQDKTVEYANYVTNKISGSNIKVIDLYKPYKSLLDVSGINDNEEYKWANGQMLSVMRTPTLYHQAALLQKEGYRSIVVGTINKTEFNLGYWGKSSDMMVDLQPIINLYKYEVYDIARELGVPEEIIKRTPKGDVSTGETDLQMIGAPYMFLDMLTYNLDKIDIKDHVYKDDFGKWSFKDINFKYINPNKYVDYFENVFNKQIYRNLHKFKVGYPCKFI